MFNNFLKSFLHNFHKKNSSNLILTKVSKINPNQIENINLI